MYTVSRKNGKLPKAFQGVAFRSYEQARSAVRKYLRKSTRIAPLGSDAGWMFHANPSITNYGFSIQKA